MSSLEKWLSTYLEEDDSERVGWRDGERIAEALANIDQVWFSRLRTKMRPRASTSWVFMQGNLRRIIVAIRGYYSGYLGLVLSKDREPVLGLIARVGDQVEVEKMIQLVLGCAVTGGERGRHIRRILSLEKEMKTEILLAVKGLELEVTLLSIKLAGKESVNINEDKKEFVVRKNSDDSGIVSDDDTDEEVMLISDRDDVMIVTKADFSCQHDGFFETTFDVDNMHNDAQKNEGNYIQVKKQKMLDFECQFDSPICITSDIIDIDDTLGISNKKDIGLDPCNYQTEDASTDPIFQDINTIHHLEEKVAALELLLLDLLGKDATLSEYEKQIKRWEKMCGVANVRYKRARQELEEVKMTVMLSVEEGDNLRMDLKQMKDGRNVDQMITNLENKLDLAKAENKNLQEKNKELEDRIWNLELDQKRQSYNPENLLRLQLNCSTSDRQARRMLMLSNDCTSSVSSGFASGGGTLYPDCRSSKGVIALPPYVENLRELQEETERLSELIGVMEVREEQLLEQVEEVGIAREKAEEKVREKENLLVTREQKDQLGRRVKNALLLTAAFGAVHQAIQQDMVMGCIPM